MAPLTAFQAYNLVIGLVVGAELVYLLRAESAVTGYRRFMLVTVFGVVTFVVAGPVAEVLAPSLVHWVHGVGALLVVLGLYSPVRNDLRTEGWARVLLCDPSQIRSPADWMRPMDDAILELFHSSELVLTPAVVALNIDRSREAVNRRLTALADRDLVERVERGKYRLTPLGEQYLRGRLHVSMLTRQGKESNRPEREPPAER
ncbi:hypothetical protein SAMN05216559_1927 [Halomicrobium zhouii]|uniref:HVO-A0261-like N-terminal domain-containing protein n=1 Tax=Halomicrobium zhouii TaxID=767519 RepID=A0A1I6L2W9_9EURY|nr:hypothetical protein [Halomicrobium zhouii]SFR97853.1 hypothetical protein SAMN05216559_1927 [Halomicrobium zhouii]